MDIFPGQEGGQNLFPKMPSQKCPFFTFFKLCYHLSREDSQKNRHFLSRFPKCFQKCRFVSKNAEPYGLAYALKVSIFEKNYGHNIFRRFCVSFCMILGDDVLP